MKTEDIKTWAQHQRKDGHWKSKDACMKAEIDELRAALKERDAKLAVLEKQEPINWIELNKEADAIVRSKPTWKRFIDCTPLSNDIAVWMADFAESYAAAGAAPVPENWRSAVAMAYGHLWHVNNEPMAPIPLRSEESASYAARKLLRDLLTTEERGEAINSVRAMLTASPKDPT